jgi:hypothetical protein
MTPDFASSREEGRSCEGLRDEGAVKNVKISEEGGDMRWRRLLVRGFVI